MIDTIKQFYSLRDSVNCPGHLAPYDWHNFNIDPLPFYMAPYSMMLEEQAREIANSVNELYRYIVNLETWRIIIKDLKEEKIHEVVSEFITPFATLALNLVYVIKSRFIYSIAHLSHQANMVKLRKEWKDDFPLEIDVTFSTADQYASRWKSYKNLKLALEKIGNAEFREQTNNFRNKYHHRYLLHFEIGDSEFVTRNVENGSVSYGLGGSTKPFKLEYLVPILEEEYQKCIKSFTRYQKLIREQIELIESTIIEIEQHK